MYQAELNVWHSSFLQCAAENVHLEKIRELSDMKKMSKPIIAIITIITIYGFFSLLKRGCPIKYWTGISCAGCGMTRAWQSLLTGHIQEAFSYHPLLLLPPFLLLIILLRNKIPTRIFRRIMAATAVLFLGVYIARLLNPKDTIIVIDLKQGALFQLIKELFPFLISTFNNW